MIIMFPRNQENLTIENLEFGDVEYETTVEISELRDNPAYTKYYTFITRYLNWKQTEQVEISLM